jgi:PAS domain S-box-containing protein
MDDHALKEKLTGYTVISAIIALVFLVFALFMTLYKSKEADFSLDGIVWIFKNNPAMWIVLTFAILAPFSVYLLSKITGKQLNEKQQLIQIEHSRVDEVNEFTRQLIHGNLEVDFHLEGENDELGETLVNLRDTLKSNAEKEEKLRKDEEQRNWIAQGLAHFSETLRNYIHEPDQLSFHVIKDLTKYVNAIQGGFYILDDHDPNNKFFNLSAFFAYDRRKFADQNIKWGDGLVGTCAMEKKTIYIKNLPEDYITVTSGLGDASPDSLIVVPMIYEDQVFGVMELASFTKFEPAQIALIEKTAESIGATLSAIKTNLRTSVLLEESKAQTQALTSHEEEMRQNMEELQATQEESNRQTQRLTVLEETLKQNIVQAEFDAEGKFIYGNSLFYSTFEYLNELNIEGKHIAEFFGEESREEFDNIWKQLTEENISYKGYLKHVTRTGKDLSLMVSLSCLMFDDKADMKVIFMGIDSGREIEKQKKQDAIVQSVNNTAINIEMDINGNVLDFNENFISLFKLSEKEVTAMVVFDVIHPIELDSFNKKWDSVIHGGEFKGLLRCRSAKVEEIWLNGAFSITMNAAHETNHVIFVGIDVTNEKRLENELHTALDTLKKQERQIKDAEKELTGKLRETKTELNNQFKEVDRLKNLNESMLEESADAIVTISQENKIIFFNKAAETLWKVQKGEILDQDISVLFPEALIEKDELLESFTRPGNNKITGTRTKSAIIDKKGKEKPVYILLTKGRVESENAYMAFFQPI